MAYGLWNGQTYTTADDIVAKLDPSIPLQRAHIQAIRNLVRDGARYSNEDTDVLGAAWQTVANKATDVPPYAAKWVDVMCAEYASS